MIRVTPAVRAALRKKYIGRDIYSDVIVRLLGVGIRG